MDWPRANICCGARGRVLERPPQKGHHPARSGAPRGAIIGRYPAARPAVACHHGTSGPFAPIAGCCSRGFWPGMSPHADGRPTLVNGRFQRMAFGGPIAG